VAEGSLADLRRRADLPVTLHVTARNGYASDIAAHLPGAILVDGALHLTCPQAQKLETLGRITGLGDRVADLDVLPPSLEDLYSHFSKAQP
jgi:Cu-processing system ATP-binding protein